VQTHLALRVLQGADKPDRDVQALFAIRPQRKALLFIHGFSGDPIKTWSDFHVLLPAAERCEGYDLFFYGYDGLRAEMNASAGIFRGFLDRLFLHSATLVNSNLPAAAKREEDFSYEHVVIIAHSLGAVITRRALLDATRQQRPWLSKTKLVLFAPAHMGASIAALALEAASSFRFLHLFSTFARFESPLINQLTPGSTTLNALLAETKQACMGGANPHLLAHTVVIAEYDRIVMNDSFGDDPPPITIPDTEHINVCKPRFDFRRPLELLEQCL
jgi:pimeloyl-ACP methyl ester carboxylesterase